MSQPIPVPDELVLHQQSKTLDVVYGEATHTLSAEYLRVYSPSAEVKGHGPGQETTQWGKRDVGIKQIDPVGSYAVRLQFDDGHDTGLYTWPLLHELATNAETKWAAYLAKLEEQGLSRDAGTRSLDSVLKQGGGKSKAYPA